MSWKVVDGYKFSTSYTNEDKNFRGSLVLDLMMSRESALLVALSHVTTDVRKNRNKMAALSRVNAFASVFNLLPHIFFQE